MNKKVAWALVVIQFVLIALLLILPQGSLVPRNPLVTVIAGSAIAVGIVVGAVAGLRLGSSLTPSPIPRDNGELRTEGIYSLVRHPIYSGLLLVGVGLALWGGSVWHVVVAIALFVLISVKARVEERLLSEKFDQYLFYAQRVGRYIPYIGRIRKSE